MIYVNTTDALGEGAQQAICDELRRFNLENNGVFFTARELAANAPRPLYAVARDGEGRLLGGLLAETQFAWMKLSIISVVPAARGCGVGSRLLAAAEAEAVSRGCRYAYADTMDYQAPMFYQKLGYKLVGRLEDWDSHGHDKLVFTKDLMVARQHPPECDHATPRGLEL
jgi:GNAT superfamily N-acetyltransferase